MYYRDMTNTTDLVPNTRNITRVFRKASLAEVQAGRGWYLAAHKIAGDLAVQYGVTREVAAGVLAATSPLNGWGPNVRLAGKVLAAGGTKTDGYLGLGLRKANAIIGGADPVATLKGHKTVNFYRSILTAGAEGVTVDRHAFSIAVGERVINTPSLSGKRYEEVAQYYRRAAVILSKEYGMELSAATVQAVTWVAFRRMYWAEGAFDVK